MSDKSTPSTVETIRQAFSYVTRFKNRLFVIKIADSLISHDLFPLFIRDVVLLHRMGIRIALVPGARSRIDQVLETFNIAWTSNQGTRITPPEAMQYVKMAASDVTNLILTLLAENSANGVVGNWVRARSIGVRDGVDYRSSGLVESVQTDIVAHTIDDGLIPIFPNVGWSASGTPYNISSNSLALTLAKELRAAKLFFATDTDAIHTDRFTAPEGAELTENG
ncbi:MAG: amino-acid N-acetyltransferase, partial [Chitinivibrionales bacterium]|nr:amino-acid N-acetyltransferase [Chitinivibrionales bacterium]